jgi:hypothetical protein
VPRHDRAAPVRTVDGEHTVEVVHLVLKQFGDRTGQARTRPQAALLVRVPDRNRIVAPYAHHQRGETHAVVVHRELAAALPQDLGVHHDERAPAEVDGDEPPRNADLGRRDCPAEAVLAAERNERALQVRRLVAERSRTDILDRPRTLAKDRVADLANVEPTRAHRTNLTALHADPPDRPDISCPAPPIPKGR